MKAKTFERDFAPASSKEGGLYVKDGKVLVVDRGSGIPVEAVVENLKPADHAWLKGYTKLRDALKDAQRAQLEDSRADWETKLDALRKEYRAFTKKNGRIKEFTAYERTTKDEEGNESTIVYRRFKWDRLLFDVEAPMVESLERITDAGEIEDGPFLLGRTLNKPVRPEIETVDDALAVTLDEIGKLDLGYIGKLIGKSPDDVVALLGDRIYPGAGR
jgi:N12 class adenine-specific DNA methylase